MPCDGLCERVGRDIQTDKGRSQTTDLTDQVASERRHVDGRVVNILVY